MPKVSYTGRRAHIVRTYRRPSLVQPVTPEVPTISAALPGDWGYLIGDDFSPSKSIYTQGMEPGAFWGRGSDSGDYYNTLTTHTLEGGRLKMWPRRKSPESLGDAQLVARHITTHSSWRTPTDKRYFLQVTAKIAPGNGQWTAIWLRADNPDTISAQPEIDLMETGAGEYYGKDGIPNRFTMNCWRDDGYVNGVLQGHTNDDLFVAPTCDTLTTQFHTWGVDCDPVSGIVGCYFDGVKVGEFTGMTRTIVQPMYLILSTNYRTTGMDPGPYCIGALEDPEVLLAANKPFEVESWHCWTQTSAVSTNTQPIVALPLVARTATEGTAFSYQVAEGAFTDPEGQALNYSASGLPSWLTFTPATRTFSGTPPEGSAGEVSIEVRATDPGGLSATSTFTLTTSAGVVNQAPVRNGTTPNRTATEDADFTYQVPADLFADPEGGALTYSATGLPSWLTFTPATRTFSGRPLQEHSGVSTQITVTATDPQGASTSSSFMLAVTPVNDAPVVATTLANQTARVGVGFSYTVPAGTFADPDGDALTTTVTGLPTWLSWNEATRTLAGTPATADATTGVTITVRATDPAGLAVSTTFTLTVLPASVTPGTAAVLSNPVVTAMTGSNRTFNVHTDADLDAVPFRDLVAGDVVNIHHKADGTPYRRLIRIRGAGTEAAPIVVNGVTDSTGKRPLFSGENATVATGCLGFFSATGSWSDWEAQGLIVTARVAGSGGWSDPKPQWIKVRNLDATKCSGSYTYTDSKGATRTWLNAHLTAGSGFRVQDGYDILLENCRSWDNDFGIFTQANNVTLDQATQRVTIRSCAAWGNGVVGSNKEHNVYAQSAGLLTEFCYFGALRDGSEGSTYKTRSSGEIIRYNWFDTSARAIDLVHSEDQWEGIMAQANYLATHVYGNVFSNDFTRLGRGAAYPIHFGGDNMGEDGTIYRVNDVNDAELTAGEVKRVYRQRLYFYDNTVVFRGTASDTYNASLFALSLSGTETQPRTRAYEWDNLFLLVGDVEWSWLYAAGELLHKGGSVCKAQGTVHTARVGVSVPSRYSVVGAPPSTTSDVTLVDVAGADYRPVANAVVVKPRTIPADLPSDFRADLVTQYQVLGPINGGAVRTPTCVGALEPA